jgi:ATP-binding cassette subfamily G (WHITE) protein 2 (SNQ2)
MSGPYTLEDSTSSAPISRVPSLPTVVGDDEGQNTVASRTTKPRRGSTVSHVDLDFFDPTGVQELRRTLTQKSTQEHNRPNGEKPSFSNSDLTLTGLTGGDGGFDFEKTLRHVVRK